MLFLVKVKNQKNPILPSVTDLNKNNCFWSAVQTQ